MLLNVQRLNKTFPEGTQALQNLSLEVDWGEVVVLLGHNGAGKSTLIRCLMGLMKPDTGSATIEEINIIRSPQIAYKKIGAVFEEAENIYGYMTVEENLYYFGLLNNIARANLKKQIKRILSTLGLEEKRFALAQTLSRGMKQKLALGHALLKQTPLLFLDEPTLGLDINTRTQMIKMLLEDLREKGILLTTHDTGLAYTVGTRFYFISKGQIIWSGSRQSLDDMGVLTTEDFERMLVGLSSGEQTHEYSQSSH